jgi:hypothetical protein
MCEVSCVRCQVSCVMWRRVTGGGRWQVIGQSVSDGRWLAAGGKCGRRQVWQVASVAGGLKCSDLAGE